MDIDKLILKEQGNRASSNSLDLILEMIEGILDQQLLLELPRRYKKSTTGRTSVEVRLSFIPDIAVSEIGWSDVSTREGEAVSGIQRTRLENFLKNVAPGGTLKDKITELQSFYEDGYKSVIGNLENRSEIIQKLLAYLVFYKTLTKVITDFNAASAGFNFESFLSVLVGGTQIQTGGGTIADLVDDKKVPISLKLYAEKTLSVEGSFRDLVNDVIDPNPGHEHPEGGMRYVVCAKDITGKKFDQRGTITFFQFDITLDNIERLMFATTPRSKDLIRLPDNLKDPLVKADFNLDKIGLTAQTTLPSLGEMEGQFIDFLAALMKGEKLELLKAKGWYLDKNKISRPQGRGGIDTEVLRDIQKTLDWQENEMLFKTVPFEGANKNDPDETMVVRGHSKMIYKNVKDLMLPFKDDIASWGDTGELSSAIINANLAVVNQFTRTKQADKRLETLRDMAHPEGVGLKHPDDMSDPTKKGVKFLSPEDSVRLYDSLTDPEMKKMALRNSLGYLGGTHTQFHINRAQAQDQNAPINSQNLGTINIGAEVIIDLLNNVKDILNEQVWEIFAALQSLSDNLNSYFAGGLTQDSQADAAVKDSQHIGTQTAQLTKIDQGDYSGPGSPYAKQSQASMSGTPMGGSKGPLAFNEEQENEEDEVIID